MEAKILDLPAAHAPLLLNDTVAVDLPTLIETRLIIQANSGGGKTWALRRILEQSHNHVQHIVIDVEGSLRTLRERFEYLLLGSATDEVDYPITPENAAMLALKLLEVRTSVIIDLYEFRRPVRQQIVQRFLDALIDAPKDLWHDCLVVLDEAHVFCPQQGTAEAKEAVEALCSRGRARGFCAILATQRISKLDKDALAECNNKLIGRASLDRDIARSNAELELPPRAADLKNLAPGEFFVFGPAISPVRQKISIGPVLTTHPQAGSRRQVSSPPPLESLKEVLAALHALPLPSAPIAEAESAEANTASSSPSARQLPPRRDLRKQKDREEKPSPAPPAAVVDQPPLPGLPLTPTVIHPQVASLLAEKDAEIQRLRAQVEALSHINVSFEGTLLPLTDLPTLLHLNTLNSQVQQAVIEVRQVAGSTPVSEKAGGEESEREREGESPIKAQVAPRAPELLYSEKKLLARLATQVKAFSLSEKALFIWLVEHDGMKVTSQYLADAVGMDSSVTWTRQTRKLVKLPFIARWGSRQFWYQAVFGPYCQKYFASVPDRQLILQHLIEVAGKGTQGHELFHLQGRS